MHTLVIATLGAFSCPGEELVALTVCTLCYMYVLYVKRVIIVSVVLKCWPRILCCIVHHLVIYVNRYFALVVSGQVALPSQEEMRRVAEEDQKDWERRFGRLS
jgi:hypothetical protein